MSSNSFGEYFKITTFGESHGKALGVIIDGVPPNVSLNLQDIQFELNRRRPGQSDITSPRNEKDIVEILSGVFEGKTTGTPLAVVVYNEDQKSKDYAPIKDIFRPGHADYTYFKKYGIRDYRGGGRSSGRETIARVAAGAVAKKILSDQGINIIAYTLSVCEIFAKTIDYSVIEKNPVRTPDMEASVLMKQKILDAKAAGDSVGGIIEAVVHGCPPGLGDPAFNKLNALLSHALISIGAIRGVEFGDGFEATRMFGSEHNDKLFVDGDRIKTMTNHAGGINGGISNGEDIVLRLAVKPTSSISQKQQAATTTFENTNIEIEGRHDPCLLPRIVPVVESMIAITLLDRLLAQKAFTSHEK